MTILLNESKKRRFQIYNEDNQMVKKLKNEYKTLMKNRRERVST